MLVLDTAGWALSFYLAHWLRFRVEIIRPPLEQISFSEYLPLLALSLPVLWLSMGLTGMYRGMLDEEFARRWSGALQGWAWALLGLLALSFFLRDLPESRLAFLLIALLSFLLIPLLRYLVYLADRRERAVYLAGDAAEREVVRGRLEEFVGSEFRVVGEGDGISGMEELPQAAEVIVWCGEASGEDLRELEELAVERELEVYLLPGSKKLSAGILEQDSLAGLPALRPAGEADLEAMERIKRVEDLVIGGTVFLLTSPLLLLGMLAVRLSSPGPVFFRHERVGRGGETFEVVKLRTMYEDVELSAEQKERFEEDFKLEDDPRVTPAGHWLRKLSIDELPQLINVLRGEISLVGPRPIVEDELDKYREWSRVLTAVRPGLTGLWQVSGRSALSYSERVELDIYYIQNWSVWLDLSIILRTPLALLRSSETH